MALFDFFQFLLLTSHLYNNFNCFNLTVSLTVLAHEGVCIDNHFHSNSIYFVNFAFLSLFALSFVRDLMK